MIKKVRIRNFKSIKDLEFKPAKINVFIGEPNTGKSNILEAIGLFSLLYDPDRPGAFVRFRHLSNLFHDENMEEKIKITFNNKKIEITAKGEGCYICLKQGRDKLFEANYYDPKVPGPREYDAFEFEGYLPGQREYSLYKSKEAQPQIKMVLPARPEKQMSPIKFYRYRPLMRFRETQPFSFLKPPNGENLATLIHTHETLRNVVSNIFEQYGYQLLLKPHQLEIEIVKKTGPILISLPYTLVADTLQRQVFFMLAIKSNKDSVLLFEEPEAHAFPRHIKTLAETIAMDKTNQFFIATHNPYLLRSIMEKAPKGSLNIYAT